MTKEMIISSSAHETRVAILEEDQVAEIFIERERQRGVVGNLYKGRVSKVLPGMQSAFVDLGLERDGFLYVTDVIATFEEFDRLETDEDDVPPARNGPAGSDLPSGERRGGPSPGTEASPDRRAGSSSGAEASSKAPLDEARVALSDSRRAGAPPASSGRANGRRDRDRDRGPEPKIEELLKEGQEIIVQVAKEPLGTKGARLTSHAT